MDNAPHTPTPPPPAPAPAPHSPASAYVQQYVPPDATEIVPSSGGFIPPLPPPGPGSWSGTPSQPSYPPPSRDKIPVGEVIFAALVPIIVCSFGSWIYFVYAGAHRHDRRQFLAAAGYGALFLVAFVFAAIDPTPVDSPDLSNAEWIGFTLFAGIAIASAVHGAVVASHPGDTSEEPDATRAGPAVRSLRPGPGPAVGHRPARPDAASSTTAGWSTSTTRRPGAGPAARPDPAGRAPHRDRPLRPRALRPAGGPDHARPGPVTHAAPGGHLAGLHPAGPPARPSPWTSPSAPPRH